MQDYLSNRAKYFIAAAKTPNLQKIDTGVPQGSVLGHIFSFVYINGRPEEFLDIQVTFFAEDTSVLQNNKPDILILIASEN